MRDGTKNRKDRRKSVRKAGSVARLPGPRVGPKTEVLARIS